jgi:hypothetical protein
VYILYFRHFVNGSLLQNLRRYGEYRGIIPSVKLHSIKYDKVNKKGPIRDVHVKNFDWELHPYINWLQRWTGWLCISETLLLRAIAEKHSG